MWDETSLNHDWTHSVKRTCSITSSLDHKWERKLLAHFARNGGLLTFCSLPIQVTKQFTFTENQHSAMLHLVLYILYLRNPPPPLSCTKQLWIRLPHASAANSRITYLMHYRELRYISEASVIDTWTADSPSRSSMSRSSPSFVSASGYERTFPRGVP
jgi:hypothetical protein